MNRITAAEIHEFREEARIAGDTLAAESDAEDVADMIREHRAMSAHQARMDALDDDGGEDGDWK